MSSELVLARDTTKYGGSAEGIKSHYDIGNDFWPAILGPTMAYSCALFTRADESLDDAQRRKIDWHLAAAGVANASSVLDIGCGWGSVLKPLASRDSLCRIHGITLSNAQAEYLSSLNLANLNVSVENWAVYEPTDLYDSIISVGAFEHFANAKQTKAEKVALYRDFFERCRRWLSPYGRMSLQTIAYGNMKAEDANAFMNDEIFPESELPFLSEIVEAMDGLFEIVQLRNDRLHYAKTMDAWGRNLVSDKPRLSAIVGEQKFSDMHRFFKLASVGFRMGKQNLFRFALRPIRSEWSVQGRDDWTNLDPK
ncbi:MAG: Cyclopropane-fatty-acyl-phospholipid synthase (EC [Candidatus Burkholderia crenata]|nr:MAG: Cyclopropane-fatty-acyl-phospholipid synthase (EC [Candidatus Burkholderia crenata]